MSRARSNVGGQDRTVGSVLHVQIGVNAHWPIRQEPGDVVAVYALHIREVAADQDLPVRLHGDGFYRGAGAGDVAAIKAGFRASARRVDADYFVVRAAIGPREIASDHDLSEV